MGRTAARNRKLDFSRVVQIDVVLAHMLKYVNLLVSSCSVDETNDSVVHKMLQRMNFCVNKNTFVTIIGTI